MEQHSQAKQALTIESQIRESFGRVVYSHKTHEKCADLLLRKLANIKLAQIVMSALTTGGFIAAAFGAGDVAAIAGTVISTLLLMINAYTKDYDLGELAQKHKQAANDLWLIREQYLSLITDTVSKAIGGEEARSHRDSLIEDLHQIYSNSPSTNSKAYVLAQKALKINEDLTFSDAEIDGFLPLELKSTRGNLHTDE